MSMGLKQFGWLLVAVVAWGNSASARPRIELMPREELSLEGDRSPTESYSYGQGQEPVSRRRNYSSRFMVGGGITTLADRQNTSGETVNHTFYLGAGAETHQGYLGGDLDLYFGSGSVDKPATSTLIQQRAGSLKQMGALFDVTLELPIEAAGFLIVPRAGIGYGAQYLSLERDFGLQNTTTNIGLGTKELVHGAFAMAGLIVSPVKMFTLSADYSTSFFSTGSVTGSIGSIDIPLGNGASSFDRIRASLIFRISRSISLGGQFVQRRIFISNGILNDPNGILSPKQRHFLGVLGFEL